MKAELKLRDEEGYYSREVEVDAATKAVRDAKARAAAAKVDASQVDAKAGAQ